MSAVLPAAPGRDPVRPFAAAAMMGVLLARGIASEAEVLAVLLEAASAAAPRRDRAGMRLRLVHALRDAAAAADRERDAAARAVTRVTAALAALWASREQIEDAAAAASAGPVRHHLLTRPEVASLTQGAVLAALARPDPQAKPKPVLRPAGPRGSRGPA